MMYELIKTNGHLFWPGLIAALVLMGMTIYFVVRLFKNKQKTLPSWAIIVWLLSVIVASASFAGLAELHSWHHGCGLGG